MLIARQQPRRDTGLVPVPVARHFQVEEGRGPGDQYQPGQGFQAGQVAHCAMRRDIAETQCGVGGKGKINGVEQAALEVALEKTPAGRVVHPVKGQRENPDLERVGGEGAENPEHYPEAVPYLEVRHKQGKAVHELVVNDDYCGNYHYVHGENDQHWQGAPWSTKW